MSPHDSQETSLYQYMKEAKSRFTIAIPETDRDLLEKIADRLNMPMGQVIVMLISRYGAQLLADEQAYREEIANRLARPNTPPTSNR